MESSAPPTYQKVSTDHMNIEMPEHVDQSTSPPSKHQVQLVQPNSARLDSPPNSYLAWSIANTLCSVAVSLCS
jgi:hypothetical protein